MRHINLKENEETLQETATVALLDLDQYETLTNEVSYYAERLRRAENHIKGSNLLARYMRDYKVSACPWCGAGKLVIDYRDGAEFAVCTECGRCTTILDLACKVCEGNELDVHAGLFWVSVWLTA